MKLFKTVVILSLAMLTLSSSVAFGCVTETMSDVPVNQLPDKDGTPPASTTPPATSTTSAPIQK